MRQWLFKTFFRGEYEHMTHLVDDVIRLEEEAMAMRETLARLYYLVQFPNRDVYWASTASSNIQWYDGVTVKVL